MIKLIAGIFLILHGLVHLFYYAQAARLFDLQAGMNWPDGSWAFTNLLGQNGTRTLASILCIIAAAGLVIGGGSILFSQSWWRVAVAASAAFSALLFLLFYNGRLEHLDYQGGIAILINAAILLAVLVFHWPQFDF